MRCGVVSTVALAIYHCKYIKGNKCIVSSLNELSNPNVSADEAIRAGTYSMFQSHVM